MKSFKLPLFEVCFESGGHSGMPWFVIYIKSPFRMGFRLWPVSVFIGGRP